MKKLIDSEKKKLGKRIKDLRDLLFLQQKDLAEAINISRGTLNAMEAGKRFSGDNLLAVSHFFAMTLSELSQYDQPLPTEQELRSRIEKYHKKHKSETYLILNNAPDLNKLIEFRLVKEGYLDIPRTVNDVVEHCKSEYDLSFESSVVSQALTNAAETGLLSREKYNGRNFHYQVKKSRGRSS